MMRNVPKPGMQWSDTGSFPGWVQSLIIQFNCTDCWKAPAVGRNQSLTPSLETFPCLILAPKLFCIRENEFSFFMGRKMIQAELSNFQNIFGRKGIYLVRYHLNSAEQPQLMHKRHSIHAETLNKCVVFGENKFQLRSYRGMESPMGDPAPAAQHRPPLHTLCASAPGGLVTGAGPTAL